MTQNAKVTCETIVINVLLKILASKYMIKNAKMQQLVLMYCFHLHQTQKAEILLLFATIGQPLDKGKVSTNATQRHIRRKVFRFAALTLGKLDDTQK